MKKIFKIFSVFIVFTLMFTSFAGCGAGNSKTQEEKKTKVITDMAGNQVEIPEKVERTVIASLWPLPSVYCMFKGSSEGLVGMAPASKTAAVNSMLYKVDPKVAEIETKFMENDELNTEELLKLKPDLVLGSSDTEREAVIKAGIPYVQFNANPKGDGNAVEAVGDWINLLEQIYGPQERTSKIRDYGNEAVQRVSDITSKIDEKDKIKELILFQYNDGTLQVAGKNSFGDFWINSAGAVNVADEVTGFKEVNMEQIYKWNPDKIIITNFCTTMPEDLYNNVIGSDDWSNLKAVKNKEVYKPPLGTCRWFAPSSDTPLVFQWIAKQNYPELFKDFDMDAEMKKYYKDFYNIDLTDEELEKIYNPSRDAGSGI